MHFGARVRLVCLGLLVAGGALFAACGGSGDSSVTDSGEGGVDPTATGRSGTRI